MFRESKIMSIYYKKGFKYQLAETYRVEIRIKPLIDIKTEYIDLSTSGMLFVRKGYAFDGASGPTIDDFFGTNSTRAALVHDSLYDLFRHEKLNREKYRIIADQIFRDMLREDGMSRPRSWYYYKGVRTFGGKAASRAAIKKIFKAP